MGTLVEKLSNCYNYFLRLSEFPDLSGKVFFIFYKLSKLDYSTIFQNSNEKKKKQFNFTKFR